VPEEELDETPKEPPRSELLLTTTTTTNNCTRAHCSGLVRCCRKFNP